MAGRWHGHGGQRRWRRIGLISVVPPPTTRLIGLFDARVHGLPGSGLQMVFAHALVSRFAAVRPA